MKTLAVTRLASGGELRWAAWCPDGVHVVLLHSIGGSQKQQAIKVWNVPSAKVTGFRGCAAIPQLPRHNGEGSVEEMFVSYEAQAVLVPESLQIVSLCRLPSLDRMAQLACPQVADAPTSLVSMGWAAHGSLIAIAWQAADATIVVTVHSGSDGRLHHTLEFKPQTPQARPNGGIALKAFTACPDLPRAAAAWSRGDDYTHFILINLTDGMHTILKRPTTENSAFDYYRGAKGHAVGVAWAPGGRHLIVHETADYEGHDWAIFNSSSGAFCGPVQYCPVHDDPPVWSSRGTFCLVRLELVEVQYESIVLDFSVSPPLQLPYFCKPAHRPPIDVDPGACAFVPGTPDLVQLDHEPGLGSQIKHWTYNAGTTRSSCHEVPGLTDLSKFDIAWHPTLRSAGIYALSENKERAAVHLIDAKRHRRLSTWTYEELSEVLAGSEATFSKGGYLLRWSPDGKKLALANLSGTIILSFVCGRPV